MDDIYHILQLQQYVIYILNIILKKLLCSSVVKFIIKLIQYRLISGISKLIKYFIYFQENPSHHAYLNNKKKTSVSPKAFANLACDS